MQMRDFQKWHTKKEHLEGRGTRVYFHEREVWWCALGANIGFEQDGKGEDFARPVLVFKKFNNEIFWALPLTAKAKIPEKRKRFYVAVDLKDSIPRFAVISQIRLVDSKRLFDKIGVIDGANFSTIQKAIMKLIES